MLDTIDRKIIAALCENGRVSYTALGVGVGLSPNAVADRVHRLERRGVITGYTAIVDLKNAGRPVDALVDVRLLANTDPGNFEALAFGLPGVREVVFLTGRFDFQLRVACGDAEELDRTVRALRRDGGVAATETRIVMRSRQPRT